MNLEYIPRIEPVAQTHKYIRTVFLNQIALNANEDLKFSNPNVFIKALKQKHNLFIEELIKSEKRFDELDFDVRVENQVSHMYQVISSCADEVSRIELAEFGELALVVAAFKKDKKKYVGYSFKDQ